MMAIAMVAMITTTSAQTASDHYLDMANYATIGAGDQTLIDNIYKYTEVSNSSYAWVTMSMYGITYCVSNNIWLEISNKGKSNLSSIQRTWNADNPFLGKSAYFISTTPKVFGYSTSQNTNERVVTFYVTNITGVRLWGTNYNNYDGKASKITIFECTKNADGTLTPSNTSTYNNSDTSKKDEFKFVCSSLDETKYYKVVCSTIYGLFYEIAFRTPQFPPSISAPQELEMETRPGSPVTTTFTVTGQRIQGDGVTLSVSDSPFTISLDGNNYTNSITLTKAQAEAGATITVKYNPTAYQNYTGAITISTQGVRDKEVTLKGYSTGYLVTIGSAGATTLYVDMPLIVPSNEIYPGLQVFYASGIADKEGGKKELSLTSLKNNIPANTGVIIIGAQGEYYFLKYRGSALSPIGDNWLSGTTTGTTREAVLSNASEGSIVMTLSKMNNQLGFYKYVNDNLAANKAYLIYKPAAGSNVTYFSFGDESGEETDAISNMKVVKVDDAWYTLQGARLNGQPTQRGIYIHGGKKVIVK